jgi:hypothetical protein
MSTSAPRRPRELFDHFRRYDAAQGLAGLIGQWDLAGVTPRQIYYSVLGRLPEDDRARQGEAFDPAGHYRNAIAGDEFQSGVVRSILRAYPEKPRKIFIHIPKGAGTHLSEKLIAAWPAVNFRLMDKNWIGKEALFAALRKLALRLESAESLVSYGHLRLKWYTTQRLVRFGDLPFSVVREPAETVLSQVNYMLTRFRDDPEFKALDTQGWLRVLDRGKVSARLAAGDVRDLAHEILFSDALLPRNLICDFLGDGTAISALELCASAGVELTDMQRYPEWLSSRLGLEAGRPINVSNRFIGFDDLGAEGRERIRTLTEQDNILVETVRRRMADTGRCWASAVDLL